MTGDKATVAVVGTGWWATTAHIPALRQNPRVADVILVDINLAAARAAAEKYNVRHYYASIAEAKAAHPDLSGAIVAVPHHAHHAAGRAVLEAGLHLLMEKPMTLYAREARDLIDLADAQGLVILMGYTFPYHEVVRRAKWYVDEGLIGEIEYVTCSMSSLTVEFLRGKPENYAPVMKYAVTGPGAATYSDPKVAGGGQAQLQITHSAAMMFHMGESQNLRAHTVSAFMGNLDARVDVIDAFAVLMENGAVATVGSTGNTGPGDPGIVEVHMHGSKGRVQVDAISGNFWARLRDGAEERVEGRGLTYPGSKPSEEFVNILLGEGEPYFPGRTNGLYTVELLDAAYRSAAQSGMPVHVASLYA